MFFLHCLFGIALIEGASNGLLRVLEESKLVPVSYPPSLPSLPQALPGTVALLTSVPTVCCRAFGSGCTRCYCRKCGFGRRRAERTHGSSPESLSFSEGSKIEHRIRDGAQRNGELVQFYGRKAYPHFYPFSFWYGHVMVLDAQFWLKSLGTVGLDWGNFH